MNDRVLFSEDTEPLGWSETGQIKLAYGPKAAGLMALPRLWTPPFALIPASHFTGKSPNVRKLSADKKLVLRIRSLTTSSGQLIVRSSIIGESIWDRGSYQSVIIEADERKFEERFAGAVDQVLASAAGRQVGLVVQRYVAPRARGEFGNLLRISKTRDHWELGTESVDGATSRIRFNTQRDVAASSQQPLEIRPRIARERLFGSIAAWLNNELLRGRSQRLNCEWLTDNKRIYVVQLDEEDEDFSGINPFQLSVAAAHSPLSARGRFLASADAATLKNWDKLGVLEELWEIGATHKPMLFFVPLSDISSIDDDSNRQAFEDDFRSLIGPNNIVVRTSVRAGTEKLPNLPRTECVQPDEAASWCIAKYREFVAKGLDIRQIAFVAHRFIASRAAAWARATPGNPIVEIHSLWGLPDALQYCPYDIWEVHVPTEVATEYPEYKSHMLIPGADGGWEYVRVKNELARNLSIGRAEAIELANRTMAIANRIGRACHVMWFVGCVDDQGHHFSIPWYWTEAHDAEKNPDRSNYNVVTVADRKSLETFKSQTGSRARQAIELKPTDLNLMRDTDFIESVGIAAKNADVPILLAGSTLAHAYYQLRRLDCTVVALGEKERSRIRRSVTFGKLVRDKIPARISERQEAEITKKIPARLIKGFLTSKLVEEALEVREAETSEEKTIELADLYEVVRALAQAEGIPLSEVVEKADLKKRKAGGFEDGLVLIQTGILGQSREGIPDGERLATQVLARKISDDTFEIPFSFFGFMEIDQVRSLVFEDLGIRLDVVLKADRIELRLSREAEQFELPLDLTISGDVES